MKYLSFKNLGGSGNVGSQLVEYCALLSVAKENNRQLVFRRSDFDKGFRFRFQELVDVNIDFREDSFFEDFEMIFVDNNLPIDEKIFNLDPNKNIEFGIVFPNCYKIFEKNHANILYDLTFNSERVEKAKKIYNEIKTDDREIVGVHVRRGDFLSHDQFCLLEPGYYIKAIEYFNSDKYKFLVFSNDVTDIRWCKENLSFIPNAVFTEDPGLSYQGSEDLTDLVLMSMCDHNITANSTYSFIAAYKNKNPNKIIVCPKNYIKTWSPLHQALNGVWYPDSWISIDNIA